MKVKHIKPGMFNWTEVMEEASGAWGGLSAEQVKRLRDLQAIERISSLSVQGQPGALSRRARA